MEKCARRIGPVNEMRTWKHCRYSLQGQNCNSGRAVNGQLMMDCSAAASDDVSCDRCSASTVSRTSITCQVASCSLKTTLVRPPAPPALHVVILSTHTHTHTHTHARLDQVCHDVTHVQQSCHGVDYLKLRVIDVRIYHPPCGSYGKRDA